jgi:hypothetical protein
MLNLIGLFRPAIQDYCRYTRTMLRIAKSTRPTLLVHHFLGIFIRFLFGITDYGILKSAGRG